jgi:hypothetical protein
MGKEWTTQEGQVTYLISMTRRPGYLPALAHLKDARCVFIFVIYIKPFGKIRARHIMVGRAGTSRVYRYPEG